MSAITKERIELFIKNPLDNGLTRGEQMELARIALASLAAEPVAWKATFTQIDHEYNTFTAMYSDKAEVERWVRLHKVGDFRAKITPLYASSPALVVPDKLPREYIRGWPLAYSDYAEGWNDCREAMLQSGNFRENKDSSTNNFREISETSTNSPLIPGEVLSAIREVARIRADFDDFDGDRRGVGDCLDEAEQELIVTINKYASQLAAEPIATNNVREQQTAVPPVPEIQDDVAQAIENLKQKLVECNRYNYCADAVKGVEDACHAAMLQCVEPASNHEELPLDYLQGQKDGLEWAAQLAEANHPQTGDWLYDDPLELAKAIRKGPDMPEFDGPTPGTPDGWVIVPKELTPEMMRAVQIRSELGGYATSNLSGAYIMFSEFWNVAVSAAPKVDDL